MLSVLSPAKTLDLETPLPRLSTTRPEHLELATELVRRLRRLSRPRLAALMNTSPALTEETWRRLRAWSEADSPYPSRPALWTYRGDSYTGFALESYRARERRFAQDHLRILSGLYGVLRPLDTIEPYRLEMAAALPLGKTRDLYAYWQAPVTDSLHRDLPQQKNKRFVINLASQEYARLLDPERLEAEVITPVFKDFSRGSYRVVGRFAKLARGRMADYIIRKGLTDPAALLAFKEGGYAFDPEQSDETTWAFLRKEG